MWERSQVNDKSPSHRWPTDCHISSHRCQKLGRDVSKKILTSAYRYLGHCNITVHRIVATTRKNHGREELQSVTQSILSTIPPSTMVDIRIRKIHQRQFTHRSVGSTRTRTPNRQTDCTTRTNTLSLCTTRRAIPIRYRPVDSIRDNRTVVLVATADTVITLLVPRVQTAHVAVSQETIIEKTTTEIHITRTIPPTISYLKALVLNFRWKITKRSDQTKSDLFISEFFFRK